MVEERKLSIAEVRGTISTSLASALGFVIALLWNNVVQGAIGVAGISLTLTGGWLGWAYFVLTAVVLTVVMVVLIVVVSRWGSKA